MKRLDSRAIDAKTIQSLLTNKNGRLEPGTSWTSACRTYILDDGSAVVVTPDGGGRHWTSYNDMIERFRELEEEAKRGEDEVFKVFPPGKGFLDQFPQLLAALPDLIDVEASTLDTTESSIDAIDGAIVAQGSERFLVGDVFPSAIAYVGEVIRRAVGGRWDVLSQDGGRTWEPDIIDSHGNRCNLLRTYKEILEHGQEGNLRAFVHHTIRTHRRQGFA
jgi:hypothetical protein